MAVPSYLTSFIGRDADLRTLRRLLAESRLVTVVGPGGSGKTRLAAELLHRESKAWPDGVWWVDLTPLSSVDDVARAVMGAMELPGQGAPIDVTAAWIGDSEAMLVLDNCEHVITGAATVASDLLQRCPALSVLATSREPLGIGGESHWPLGGLAPTDSTELFVARAIRVAPDFGSTKTNELAIAEVCRKVDALPLAIELAAAHAGFLTPGEIVGNLENAIGRGAAPERSGVARHRSMAATIEWSYRLLSADEAKLFRRLSVFRGGFDLPAADAVGGFGFGPATTALLEQLTRKSMVQRQQLEDDTSRYRLLELPLAFAAEQLRESGEAADVETRHHDYYATSIGRLPNPWLGPVGSAELQHAETWKKREIDNLWAAMRWARDNSEDLGLRLALLVVSLEGQDIGRSQAWVLDLVERSTATAADLSDAFGLLSELARQQGDYTAAQRFAERRADISRRAGDDIRVGLSLQQTGLAVDEQGDHEQARRLFHEAAELIAQAKSPRLHMVMKNTLAISAAVAGNNEDAVRVLDDAISQARAEGDDAMLTAMLDSIAIPLLALAEVDRAERCWRECLELGRRRDDLGNVLCALRGLAMVANARRDDTRTLRLASAARRWSAAWSLVAERQPYAKLQAAITESRNRLTVAVADRAWQQGDLMSAEEAIRYALEGAEPANLDARPLTRREAEVVRLVAEGTTYRGIAERLFISERTAEGHVERIRNKLGVRSRSEVAAWAVAHGLLDPPENEKGTLADPPLQDA